MSEPGRPSKDDEDWPKLEYMTELWASGEVKASIRRLSRIAIGLDAASLGSKPKLKEDFDPNMKEKPSSAAERLRVKFKN